jgi:hypothetical protein
MPSRFIQWVAASKNEFVGTSSYTRTVNVVDLTAFPLSDPAVTVTGYTP